MLTALLEWAVENPLVDPLYPGGLRAETVGQRSASNGQRTDSGSALVPNGWELERPNGDRVTITEAVRLGPHLWCDYRRQQGLDDVAQSRDRCPETAVSEYLLAVPRRPDHAGTDRYPTDTRVSTHARVGTSRRRAVRDSAAIGGIRQCSVRPVDHFHKSYTAIAIWEIVS